MPRFCLIHCVNFGVEKAERERGYYLHPELYGAPEEKNVEWARHPEVMQRMKERQAKLCAVEATVENRTLWRVFAEEGVLHLNVAWATEGIRQGHATIRLCSDQHVRDERGGWSKLLY